MKISERLTRFCHGTVLVLAFSTLTIGVGAKEEKHNLDGKGFTENHGHSDSRSGCKVSSQGGGGGISILGTGGQAAANWSTTGCWAAPQESNEYMHYHDISKDDVPKVERGHLSCKSTEWFAVTIEVNDDRKEVTKIEFEGAGNWSPGTMKEITVIQGALTVTYIGGKCLLL